MTYLRIAILVRRNVSTGTDKGISSSGGAAGLSNHKHIFILLLLCCIFLDCIHPPMSSDCKEFFSVPLDQQGKALSTYPLEKQLDLYRCGMNRRPPASYLAKYIADGGENAIPVLLEKLETENDELTQYGVIDIFEVMSIKGHLRNRPDVINRIRQVVIRMKISTFKQMAQESLEKIEKNSVR